MFIDADEADAGRENEQSQRDGTAGDRSLENRPVSEGRAGDRSLSAADAAFVRGAEPR